MTTHNTTEVERFLTERGMKLVGTGRPEGSSRPVNGVVLHHRAGAALIECAVEDQQPALIDTFIDAVLDADRYQYRYNRNATIFLAGQAPEARPGRPNRLFIWEVMRENFNVLMILLGFDDYKLLVALCKRARI